MVYSSLQPKIILNTNSSSYHFFPKIIGIFFRFLDYFRLLPRRIYRLVKYVFRGFWNLRWLYLDGVAKTFRNRPLHKIGYWMSEVAVSFLEVFGIGEIYETICDFTKPNSRPLYDWEIKLAEEIFGDSINYQRVRIDESAHIGPRQQHFCYVSFYIINSWGKMSNSTLIHELVHVWQYENMGAVYIPRALYAQTTKEGYNYGGLNVLKLFLMKKKTLYDFNLEQQGDIFSDYFKIKNGYPPEWGEANQYDMLTYERIIYGKLKRPNRTSSDETKDTEIA